MKFLYASIVLLIACFQQCFICINGSKILMLTPLGSKSHKNFFWGLAEELGKRGHAVTVVSMYKNKDLKNVREVVLPGPHLDNLLNQTFTHGPDFVMKNLMTRMPEMCSESLGYYQATDVNDEEFDVILMSLFMNFCYMSVVHDQKVPFIYVSPAGMISMFSEIVGNAWIPAIEANIVMAAKHPLSFVERIQSALIDTMFLSVFNYYTEPAMDRICRERGLCAPDMPYIAEFHQNVSLILANSVQTLEIPPKPMMPNVVHAGGLHCHPGKPLPKDLEEWVQGSGDAGFIFFSMGSAMRPSFLTDSYRKILLRAFGSLEQRVLFKWDLPTMEDLPENVKIGKWLPQQDLLAHPKMKLFITHGGLHSTMETTYHGVPIIGIPLFADQYGNLKDAQSQGWARVITWPELEEEKLINLIEEVIGDEKMKKLIKERSSVMKDQVMPPVDVASYWVEYVIRHNGADHIKSPIKKMAWYSLKNLDVWCTIIASLLGLIYGIFRGIKMLFNCCFSSKSQNERQKKLNKKKKIN